MENALRTEIWAAMIGGDELEKEIWKDVPGWNGLYQVSSLGRVRSSIRYGKYAALSKYDVRRYRLLKPNIKKKGYAYVTMCAYGMNKTSRIHKLVMQAFTGYDQEGFNKNRMIHHINGIRDDNRLSNLAVCTMRENALHTQKAKPVMCISDGRVYGSLNMCAEYYGVSKTGITASCIHGREYKGRKYMYLQKISG